MQVYFFFKATAYTSINVKYLWLFIVHMLDLETHTSNLHCHVRVFKSA